MISSASFQKLKRLHENLHSNLKGLVDVVAINKYVLNGCSSASSEDKFVQSPQLEEFTSANNGELLDHSCEEGSCFVSLVKAVQDIHESSSVKLTPHKIFVGNISYQIKTSQLKAFFLPFGRVLHAQIIKERVKKRSKGYGFVTFSKESEVQKVLQTSEDELILDGRVLRINRAEKKRRGRPIRESCNETDPKVSLEDFLRKYNEATEPKCSQFEESADVLAVEISGWASDEISANICQISSLNDDTLLHIFSFLNIKDRVKIERVCHRWLQLARQTWLFVTHLEFKGIFRSFTGTGGLTDGVLLSLFRRGCQNLRTLDVSHSSRLLTDYSLYLIGQNCVDLQELNLSGVDVTMKSLKDLSSKCCKLKKIQLQRCHDVGEKALWWLFKQCKELEYVDVGGNIRITGQCFFMLTDRCKIIILDDCLKLTDSGLQLLIKRCPYLTELSISSCLYLTDTGVSELLTTCINLKKLLFCKSPKQVSSHSLMELRNVKLLEELQLAQQDAVNDDILFVIGNNCPNLRFLNIEACHNVTDRGIQSLTSCFWLDQLIISYLDKVTDSAVVLIAQHGVLRILHARSCFNITDKAVEQLSLHCPNLQELDLSGSERIRNTSLDHVEEYLGDKENISLVLGGTGVSRERVLLTQQRHPNWSITTQNLSDHHLRVDFDPYMDMGLILPEYDDDDEEDKTEEFGVSVGDEYGDEYGDQYGDQYDADYYLSADDPSTWEYQEQWMS